MIVVTNFGNGISEYYSTSWVSTSIQQSREKGSFVCELSAYPKNLEYDGLNIQFDQFWIEKQTKLKYSWVFFSNYYSTGKYRLCFNLKNKDSKLPFEYFFIDQNGKSLVMNGDGNKEVFNTFIEIDTFKQAKISLVKSFKESRLNSIIIKIK